jgi:Flp pilus assembly protein TadD
MVMANPVTALVEEGTFQFSIGDTEGALVTLRKAAAEDPSSFEAWHALAEVCFSARLLDEALVAADKAHALKSDDLFINTTLSRIWMERGDKATAERYGARAKMLSWKEELKGSPKRSEPPFTHQPFAS